MTLTQRTPRILILGNYCSANRGDAAILSGLIALSREAYPEARIAVSSWFPALAEEIHGVPAVGPLLTTPLGYKPQAFRKRRALLDRCRVSWLRPFLQRRLTREEQRGLDLLVRADLVIGAGGTYLNDNYRPAIVGRLHELDLAKRFGKPVVLLGHSIGPFSQVEYHGLAREVLNRMDAIGVRDEASERTLASLGVSGERVFVTGDTAYFSSVSDAKTVRAIAEKEVPGFGEGPMVSVSVRRWHHYRTGDKDAAHAEYVEKMARVCDHVVDRHGGRMVFLSTCTRLGGYSMDDRDVADEVLRRMQRADRAAILRAELTAEQLAALYGLMDLHVGTRLHSVILAAMGGTPSVAVAYECKSHEFMRQMGLAEYVVDIGDFTEDSLVRRIDCALADLDTFAKQVAQGMDRARRTSHKNLYLIRRVMDSVS